MSGGTAARALDPDDTSYDAAFAAWARGVVERKAAQKPHLPPYPLDQFDGCSSIPDEARDCCLLHDVRYWGVETPAERLAADRGLRDCLIGKGAYDPAWRWLWWLRGWAFFAGVRAFGWRFAGKGAKRPPDTPKGGLP